jgi:CMP/dCMP kinase
MSQKLIVAIDGPAGSGKSTSAKLVAQKLGYLYIDTGAMYRAITYLAQKNALTNNEEITKLAEESEIELKFENGITNVKINGEDVTDKIRDISVNKRVSDISKIEGVRKALVKKQQAMGSKGNGVVMEGRDITTVVFPQADVKIFLTASIEQRAKRRAKEYAEKGTEVSVEEIKDNLLQRDEIDSTREVSPLTKASDAVEVDTSKVTIEEQVNIILHKIRTTADRKGIKVPL